MLKATAIFTPANRSGIISAITAGTQAGVTETAVRVHQIADSLVPIDTGALKESGNVGITETGNAIEAEVSYTEPYAAYVEFGTGIRGASSPGAGPGPYSPGWPGMPAQPYLRPAFDAVRGQAQGIVKDRIEEKLK